MTIPATNTKLLITEDWKKIYQSFRNADFQSYDFETIRRVLISYLQENYPEDFNDFIDSSEYIALIDLIAFLGQNLSFRIDLNARENFLETAQRRDSILRLAQLISYVPKRNVPASGLLKITSLSTTENVVDSTGINLANSSIAWNDVTNSNWYEQFITIMNSAMEGSTVFGKPNDRNTINGIVTEQYILNSSNLDVPIYSFTKGINGTSMAFEIAPATFSGQSYVYEDSPAPAGPIKLLYQNDNKGSGSANTGFFALFKQGTLGLSNFSVTNPVPNEIVGININNINDTDVWLWQLNSDGTYPTTPWTKVSNVAGNNAIYNSIDKIIRNIYSVTSRNLDQIDLNFSDGSFGNLPRGNFSLFYRQSNGLSYSITPEQMTGVSITIPYVSKTGENHNLTLILGLQYTVTNSASPETNASIQSKAPQAYYTQNRMVTGEDYNIAPLTVTSDVIKIKSINRVSSGISKYFELSDVSGKYSSTNIFATDGILYKDINEQNFSFSFNSRNDIFSALKNKLEPVIKSPALRAFYIDKYRSARPIIPNTDTTFPEFTWNLSNSVAGQGRGYFNFISRNSESPTVNVPVPSVIGSYVNYPNLMVYATAGALIKFVPPPGPDLTKQYFLPNGKIVSTKSSKTKDYIWSSIIQVIGDGSNLGLGNLDDGTGPVILGNQVGTGAIPVEIIPRFVNSISYSLENDLVNLCLTQRNFGLRLSTISRSWTIIKDTDLDLYSNFSLAHTADTSNSNLDASWLIAFTWTGSAYTVRYRQTEYIFQSEKQTGFYKDTSDINFDYTNNTVIKDKIDILSINSGPGDVLTPLGVNYSWQIDSSVTESDGYINPAKVKISLYDNQDAGTVGQLVDPDTFNNIVGYIAPGTGFGTVMFKRLSDGQRYQLVNSTKFLVFANENAANLYFSNQLDPDYLYYFSETNVVKSVSLNSFVYEPSYFVHAGRSELNFHYLHNSGEERRIDPSKSNIVDVYMLTSEYDAAFRNWLLTGTGTSPLPPTSQSLENNYSKNLEPIKTISDEIIYQPVSYKVLFGSNANINLQAKFKAVRNSATTASDNDIRSRILTAINTFFSLDNWDFGQSFYFSELVTYVMNSIGPDITNFVIIPVTNNFGSLYEVACQSNEIFISGALASDIEIISAVTASQLNTQLITTGLGI